MDIDSFETETRRFLSWLQDIGVRINPKVRLADLRSMGRGRGLVAESNIDEDEVLFSIPRGSVLNARNFCDSDQAGSLKLDLETLNSMPSWLALTAIMASESCRQDSRWAPYFAILPTQLDSLVFWSDAELEELQTSAVINKVGKANAERLFAEHLGVAETTSVNVELCHKIASVIMAYAFDIPEEQNMDTSMAKDEEDDGDDLVSDDEEETKTILSMVPLADMLNADADRNNARLSSDNEELEMVAIKPIQRGEEIFNDYGQLPRSDLLRRYGYVTERYAAYDVTEISTDTLLSIFQSEAILKKHGLHGLVALSATDLKRRVDLAEREAVLEDSYDVARASSDAPSIPDELLALVYILLLDDLNLESLLASETSLPGRSKLATELVGKILVCLFQLREDSYKTTLEEDEELLKAGGRSHRETMAIQVRLGEKRVLREAAEEARTFHGSNKRMRLSEAVSAPLQPSRTAKQKRGTEEDSKQPKKRR
ncbi:hypothetical protein F5884DRAFT_98662 [Xylogone sp. PMI_703]|nr:hypothetical protein F5884DRAFT_98662 [Xylogone sp. PMI_703]